jgi:hypothetical protein
MPTYRTASAYRMTLIVILSFLNLLLIPLAVGIIVWDAKAVACSIGSTMSVERCIAESFQQTTLVREGSRTHAIVGPNQIRDAIFETILSWLALLVCVWLEWRLIKGPWADPKTWPVPEIGLSLAIMNIGQLAVVVFVGAFLVLARFCRTASPSTGTPVAEAAAQAQKHFEMGVEEWKEGKSLGAAIDLGEAARIHPTPETYRWLASIALQQGKLDEAIQWSTLLIQLDQYYDKGSGYSLRATALYRQHKEHEAYPDAIAACDRGDADGCKLVAYCRLK